MPLIYFQAARRDLVLTSRSIFLIGREAIKKGPEKGKAIEVMKRKLDFENISHVSLSALQVCGCNGYRLYVRQVVGFRKLSVALTQVVE